MKDLFLFVKEITYGKVIPCIGKWVILTAICWGGANVAYSQCDLNGGKIKVVGDDIVCYNDKVSLESDEDPSGDNSDDCLYGWEYRTNGDNNTWSDEFKSISGQNFMAIAEVQQATDTMQIRRKVFYDDNCFKYSDTITITVAPKLNPGSISSANETICSGETAVFTSNNDASGGKGEKKYQWWQQIGSGGWIDINGANSATYTSSSLTQTVSYRREVKDDCTTDSSNIVTVTITTVNKPDAQTTNITACYDGKPHTPEVAVTAKNNESLVWYNQLGEIVYNPHVTNSGKETFYVAAKNLMNGCISTERAEVTVTVKKSPTTEALNALQSIQNLIACYNGQEHKVVEPKIVGHSVVWYRDVGKITPAVAPSQKDIGTSAKVFPAIKITETGCESAAGNPVTVTVNGLPATPSITDVEECFDEQEHAVIVPTLENQTIEWYTTPDGNITTNVPSRSEAGETIAYAVARNTATGCESATRTAVSVTISNIADANLITITGEQTICSGATTTLTASSSIENAVYKWYSSQDAKNPFHTGNEYTTPALTADTIYYTSVSGDGYCENLAGNRQPVTITVNPVPELISSLKPNAIFSDSVFNYTAISSIEGTEYSWTRLDISGLKPDFANATDVIAETLTNSGISSIEVIYLITLTSPSGCTAEQNVTVKVNPNSIAPIIISQPNSLTYCVCEKEFSGTLEVVAETVEGATLGYQWYRSDIAGVEGVEAIPEAIESSYSTPTGLPVGTYYFYCKISSDYCATPVYSDIVTVTVEPDVAQLASLSVNGNTVSIKNSESEYMMQCGEDYAVINVVASSEYAVITVDNDNGENFEIPLNNDVTEIKIRIETCDKETVYFHTLTVMKPLEKLIFQRWENSLAVDLNVVTNGGYDDIRGVRWYKNDLLFEEQTKEKNAVGELVIKLDAPVTSYFAEVNIAGRWHRICGEPVKREMTGKIIAYPNPVDIGDNITVELPFVPENGYINIVSLSGSIIKRNIPLLLERNTISVADFAPGVYIMQIIEQPQRREAIVETLKLIVN